MRILIDECLPRRLKRELPEHAVHTVQEMGWSGVKNGALLRNMTGHFDVFLTIDGNLQYQQNLSKAKIAVIVLVAANSKMESLLPLLPVVREQLSQLQPGDIARFGDTP